MYQIILLILVALTACAMLYVDGNIVTLGDKEYDVARLARIAKEDMPAECQGLTYCTIKPKNYPTEYFDNLFKECLNELPRMSSTQYESYSDVEERIAIGGDYWHTQCTVNVTFEPIFAIRSELEEEWNIVFQKPPNYFHKIRLARCLEPGEECFTDGNFRTDIETHCEQETSRFEFVVMNWTTAKLMTDEVFLPICCSCFYKEVGFK